MSEQLSGEKAEHPLQVLIYSWVKFTQHLAFCCSIILQKGYKL